MTNKLIIGVPSKGRLQENTFNFFARAGLKLVRERGERDYRGTLAGFEQVEVQYLSASDIANELARGSIHLGITGEDLIRENIHDAEARVTLLTPLGFGHANVVVAVPQAWIDVKTMSDIEDVAASFRARTGNRARVATKYINLTRKYFSDHNVSDYRIVESLGATEGAPAAGTAEMVVDITSSGATLAANALKIIDDGIILRSEANLVASRQVGWSAGILEVTARILGRIAAEEQARTTREIRAHMGAISQSLSLEIANLFGAESPYDASQSTLTLHCAAEKAASLAQWLVQKGATHVSVQKLEYMFSNKNPLFEMLKTKVI
jgi:ATP phosphoribosyltransferase